MPCCAARWMVSRRLHATQTGGCGFWRGLGTTLRGGIVTYVPVMAGERRLGQAAQRDAQALLPHRRASASGSIMKPPSSASDDDSPLPKSARPPDRRSRVAIRSAMRAGMVERRRRLDDAVTEPDPLACAATPRRGTARARSSGCTPRGSGARPPRRSRCRGGRRARTARARSGGARTRSRRPTAGAAGARRRSRTSRRPR